jgi:threonine aldolase
MRQAGVIAAGALYALENHVERLAEDHANARRLADGIDGLEHLELLGGPPDTNLLFFRVDPAWGAAAGLVAKMQQRGLLMLATAPDTIRAVTHLDVNADDVEQALEILGEVVARR